MKQNSSSNRLIFVLSEEIKWTMSSFYSAGKMIIRLNEWSCAYDQIDECIFHCIAVVVENIRKMFHFSLHWFESIIIYFVRVFNLQHCFHLISSQLHLCLIHPYVWSNWNGFFLCVGINCAAHIMYECGMCVCERGRERNSRRKTEFRSNCNSSNRSRQDRWWILFVSINFHTTIES